MSRLPVPRSSRPRHHAGRRKAALVAAAAAFTTFLAPTSVIPAATAAPGPVGAGFTVTAGDLSFILKQIKISERHSFTLTPSNPCGTLVNRPDDGIPDAQQVPDELTSYGLRTTDGSCNNLFPDRENFAAADQQFPRLTSPVFRDAENSPPEFGPTHPTSYKQKKGSVFDTQPRIISNLIVDQTSTNPAAVQAAGFPVRTQGNPGVVPCTTDPGPTAVDGIPAGCVPSGQTLFIPNVTTDVGLSPPYSSMFTFFGQFFDHGVDQTVKSGGTVFVPLNADDPLIIGKDGIANTADDPQPGDADFVPVDQRFMVLTRAQNQPGPDGVLGDRSPTSNSPVACTGLNTPAGCDESADDVQNANNTDSPWVDQSQTYTSHSSHQVFLREYEMVGGKPVSTGKLLGGLVPADDDPLPCATGDICYNDGNATAGSISTWAATRKQAAEKLGMLLTDADVTNIPMLATDPYGEFIPGPNGLPQYVTTTGMVEGNLANPVPVPANVRYFDTPFVGDIAHNADPSPADLDHNPATPPTAPRPDDDSVASADFANQPAGTYDDEMLNDHLTCGDGRCNENIALSMIHQTFHHEHDRLVGDIKTTLAKPANAALLAAFQATNTTTNDPNLKTWTYGDRLFQAARFVTEMEYQHLVFEEFARKVVPAVRPFHVYSPDMNPAIQAEFAHAVYRFGHSMLDDDVARTNRDGSDNSLPLLDAFLNPPEFFDGGTAGTLTPEQAAGSIAMGSSDQVGNELDEFVTETLRNNLLGLPLDLPTINMARARDAGIPPLNEVRRQINAETNDAQLAPYTSWSDFGQHLKHPESLINFVAAYGTHPSILSATTLKAKRAAAKAIVDPSAPPATNPASIPADAAAFMFSTDGADLAACQVPGAVCGDWTSNNAGVTTTGLDSVDLWVGGLAEITNLFGGLLGSTFNYVFQTQLESLQDGDRLYYLARTPGMNLRTQLESNSFSEMIQRNSDGANTLKADAFATADCKFQLAHLNGTAAGFSQFGSTVADDPATECPENLLLLRKPDGTIQYKAVNSVDPSGINGQSVYNGSDGNDRVAGGNDNDTFWGGLGNDRIEGQGGDDVALGGEGNDIITDLDGADVHKGGPGNDAIDTGPGDDIFMGGDGQDFMNGGANDNESFAGEGSDFVIAGQGADALFGDGGDDWIQGGSGQDLLIGDHAAPFFDDPAEDAPGNDVFVGQVGENDYDAEGGDDIMSQNAAVDRNAGSGGFDWAIHQYDTVGANDDMMINNNLVGVPLPVVVNRDRWQETEADSGSAFGDVIRGDDEVPRVVGGAGFTGCDALDQAGLDRIPGLAALLPPLNGSAADVAAVSATGTCPLSGPVWGDGNILLGGGGGDTIQGRGGDDVIDGDRFLSVRISVRTNPANPASEIGSTDLMEHQALSGSFGANTTGETLQKAVFDGDVNPGNLVIVREILTGSGGTDTALFAGPRANYTILITPGTGGQSATLTVTQIGANVAGQKISDGIDVVRNMEALKFSDQTVQVRTPSAPTIGTATSTATGSATVTWTGPVANGGPAITSFEIVATPTSGTAPVVTRIGIARTALTGTVTGLVNGTAYTLKVRAVNMFGPGALSAASNAVTVSGPPGVPTGPVAVRGDTTAALSWNAPASDGGTPITGYVVQVRTGATVVRTDPLPGAGTSTTVTGLTNGTAYNFRVAAVNARGTSAFSAASPAVTPASVPGAPVLATPVQGTAGGALTASISWTPPVSTGGANITGYTVSALRVNADGSTTPNQSVNVTAGTRTRNFTFTTAGTYVFEVLATNAVGSGPAARSGEVVPR